MDPNQQDPFAAIAKPIAPAAPTAPTDQAQADPFSAIAKPAGAPSPTSGLGALTSHYLEGADDPGHQSPELGGVLAGAAKSAGGMVGNILDLVNPSREKWLARFIPAYKHDNPNGTDQDAEKAYNELSLAKAQKHVQDAADWLRSGSQPEGTWEHIGMVGEQVLEYMGTDGLLKIVGRGAAGANAAAHTATTLKNAQQVTQTLATNPRLAGLVAIGLKATKDAAMMGGQTYLHTEDPTQALEAAGTGGLLRAGGEAVGAAGRWVNRVKPKTLDIAGVDVPALASQVNENGRALEGGAAEAPAIADAQQKGAQQIIGNVAQSAARTALERINQTRPAFSPILDSARLLPAGEGAEPYTFTLSGTPTTEEGTGQLLHEAGKFDQHAYEQPNYTGGTRPNPLMGSEGSTGADIQTTGQPEAKGETVGGGGNLKTADPAQAEAWLRQIEEIQQNPLHSKLSPAQQSAIEDQRQNLSEQLSLYHASPYAQRFAPIDIDSTLQPVRSFGDAADQIQAAAKPIYSELDKASGGDFDKWNKASKQALRIMRSATSMDAYESAEQKYHEASGQIDNLLTRHAGSVAPKDYQAAKLAWRDSSRLNELHTVFERMMNGITPEESDQGLTRVMTGRTKQLENYLAKDSNREQIQGLIGQEGVTNLKQLTQLMSTASGARAGTSVLKNVVTEIGRHARVGGFGGAVGGLVASHFNLPWYEGAVTGGLAAEGVRSVMRDAMTNPRIGKMVEYAASKGLSPKVYAPLIARMIATPMQEQNPDEEKNADE